MTFRGRRGPNESGREFLASSDNWFRPTMLKTGPDGALWIADMYRAVIEHPEWIPDDWEKRLDLRAGSEQGRIYRVYPVDRKPRPIPRLDRLDEAGLVDALDSPSGWQRDTAQRLLLHRGGTKAVGPLRTLIVSTKRPQTRVQAIWTLADLGGLDEASALTGLTDADPRVREAIVAAVETAVAQPRHRSPRPCCGWPMIPRAGSGFAWRCCWATGTTIAPARRWRRLARRDGNDPWMRAAILCSALPHVPALLAGLLGGEGEGATPPIVGPLLELAGSIPGGMSEAAVRSIGQPAGQGGRHAPWQFAALAGLIAARERSRTPLSIDLDRPFAGVWESARRLVGDDAADEAERLAAVALLRHSAARNVRGPRSARRAAPSPGAGLAPAGGGGGAGTSAAKPGSPTSSSTGGRDATPQVRAVILDTLLSRPEWSGALLSALEANRVAPAEIDPARRQRLLNGRDPALRSRPRPCSLIRARRDGPSSRTYRSALKSRGNPAAGAAVFKKLCISCHRMGNEGVEVGPDLATLNDKSPESLLVAILDPNRALESKYAAFTVATVNGRVLSGLIASESATSVTLRRQEGKDDVLLRSEIEEMTASGQSLMPEGIEKDLTPRDLADLIAYIATTGPTRKSE